MLTHGGDIAGYFDQYGCEPLDFSANVSPLGLPEGVRRAVIDSLSTADQYPDPLCRRLRAAIGAFEGVDPDSLRQRRGGFDFPAGAGGEAQNGPGARAHLCRI